MSEGWEDYDASPIETFHSEAMKEFHKGAEFEINETTSEEGIRFVNGIEFNRLLARFKTKVMKHYGISSKPIPKKVEPNTFGKELDDEFEKSMRICFNTKGLGGINRLDLFKIYYVYLKEIKRKELEAVKSRGKSVELNEQCKKCFKLDLVCVGHSIKYDKDLMCFDSGPDEP